MFHGTQFQPETGNMENKRKKWTPREEVTSAVVISREKRKWQLAMRRYILEENPSQLYAPHFGLDIKHFRKWIELQFTDNLDWANFGSAWQFEHIVPVAYFDFMSQDDMSLCWNFINIKVEKIESGINTHKEIDILAARPYFESLYAATGYSICKKMVQKIKLLEARHQVADPKITAFIIQYKEDLEHIISLSAGELNRVNRGLALKDILLEREILKKFSQG